MIDALPVHQIHCEKKLSHDGSHLVLLELVLMIDYVIKERAMLRKLQH